MLCSISKTPCILLYGTIIRVAQLVYDQESGTVYLQGVVTIPGPDTATLSLLALAALAARRRRKG